MSEYVYIIAWSPRGPTKIGRAAKPIDRLFGLQTACPYRLRIYSAVRTLDAGGLEAAAHAKLQNQALLGEWFKCSPSQAKAVINALIESLSLRAEPWRPSKAEIQRRQHQLNGTRPSLMRARAALSELTYWRAD